MTPGLCMTPGFTVPAVAEPVGVELATMAFLAVLRELISDFFLMVTARAPRYLDFPAEHCPYSTDHAKRLLEGGLMLSHTIKIA